MTILNEIKFVEAFESIAKSFERVAAAMEKENAPGGLGQGQGEVRNQLTMAFQEEALRFQSKDAGLFQSGEHNADSSL